MMKKIIQTIKKYQKFLISTHVNPDPDALCSELAVALFLKSLGKKVTILNEEEVLTRFHFFPGVKQIKAYKEKQHYNYDVAIIVDCGDLNRIGKVKNALGDGKILINIDHHITNDFFGNLNLVLKKSSSTAEVLYELLLEAKCKLTKNLAINLYCGIMTDTGSFRYSNTSSRTHHIVSELRKFNFSATELYSNLYETISLKDSQEFARIISKFDTLYKGKIIYVELRKKVVERFSEAFDLRDALFRFLRSIYGVEAVVICTEFKSDKTRVNLRSSGNINVAKIAAHFKGGGHHNASGCQIDGNIAQARQKVLKEIKKSL
ncbi:3'-to-5' oligoribonuclease A, Bacillus type [hydrothermal vent metagenome]|uniref:3'-to-5' oligoribonuclease A, Bacillus type n=1 Tax=hydrothermal vent metagenome TaxID=652676 RepID=A0A3B1DMY7_9ZZZZ